MPKVRITETKTYDLEIAWLDPENNRAYTDEEIEEIAREWKLSGGPLDDDEGFQHNPETREEAILSATLNMNDEDWGLQVEIIDEEATNET
ncbi:MAG: hypothetical protein ACREOP_06285 [Thermodesulfobacteriota bacterium]